MNYYIKLWKNLFFYPYYCWGRLLSPHRHTIFSYLGFCKYFFIYTKRIRNKENEEDIKSAVSVFGEFKICFKLEFIFKYKKL